MPDVSSVRRSETNWLLLSTSGRERDIHINRTPHYTVHSSSCSSLFCLSLSLSLFLSLSPSLSLSLPRFLSLSIYLSISLSSYLSIYLYLYILMIDIFLTVFIPLLSLIFLNNSQGVQAVHNCYDSNIQESETGGATYVL